MMFVKMKTKFVQHLKGQKAKTPSWKKSEMRNSLLTLIDQRERDLVRKETNKLMVTMNELQGSFVQIREPYRRITIKAALHLSSLYEKWVNTEAIPHYPLRMPEAKCPDLTKQQPNYRAIIPTVYAEKTTTEYHLINTIMQSNMGMAASICGGVFHKRKRKRWMM